MDVMLVVDMQVGLLNGDPKHDLGAVIERINRLAANIRERSGTVIFVQHCGGKGDDFEPETPGWALLPELRSRPCRYCHSENPQRSLCRDRPRGPPEGDCAGSGLHYGMGDRFLR